jgi:hypothetical protein
MPRKRNPAALGFVGDCHVVRPRQAAVNFDEIGAPALRLAHSGPGLGRIVDRHTVGPQRMRAVEHGARDYHAGAKERAGRDIVLPAMH